MATGKVTKSALIEDLQSLNSKNPGNITRNYYRANGKFSEAEREKFFPKFCDFLKAAGIEKPSDPEVHDITGDSYTITLPKTEVHTLEELIETCKVDTTAWEIVRFNAWYKSEEDGTPLYRVTAFLKKRKDILDVIDEIERLKDLAKAEARKPKAIERPTALTGNMLEINVPDTHFGKLAWGVETGYENYDVKIAQSMFMRALNTLLQRTSNTKFDEIIFVVGNDLFNSDNIENQTTRGTVVTTDGRYHKTFYKVRSTIIEAIEMLRKIARVKVIMVPGNHDNLSVWHLGDSLECYFHKYDDVRIDNEPKYRKYHQFGQVMLMLTHGDKGDRQDYPLLMATEQPKMFGETKFREAHTGHTHRTKLDEQHGVRVRVLPALCPPDDWHAENGFVGNLRNAEAYIWNKEEGLTGIAIYSDNAQTPIITKRDIVVHQKK
jgi:predicted phosphodiesterase